MQDRYYTAEDVHSTIELLKAQNERLRASLERLLEEFDFMIEAEMIPDTRNDIIFVEARDALWNSPEFTRINTTEAGMV